MRWRGCVDGHSCRGGGNGTRTHLVVLESLSEHVSTLQGLSAPEPGLGESGVVLQGQGALLHGVLPAAGLEVAGGLVVVQHSELSLVLADAHGLVVGVQGLLEMLFGEEVIALVLQLLHFLGLFVRGEGKLEGRRKVWNVAPRRSLPHCQDDSMPHVTQGA